MDVWNEVTLNIAPFKIGRLEEEVNQDAKSETTQANSGKDGLRSKCQTRIDG
jgi:hypothetical protein